MANVKISGGPELEAALTELGGKIAGRLGTNAVRAGARVIAAAARQKVPVRTGRLKKSIRIFDDRELSLAKGSERAAYAGTREPYAHLVEFGTAHSAAKPFLRPALDESAQDALDKLTDNLAGGIERETAKYRGR
ncbi:MAG TPA: HK97-gp10 family putative phage morphogenesis protein [Rhizorhapis sp.]|nr:HK97-gp10 family putative phage morphogenesis protein [Rhizorhapis sp.]